MASLMVRACRTTERLGELPRAARLRNNGLISKFELVQNVAIFLLYWEVGMAGAAKPCLPIDRVLLDPQQHIAILFSFL